MPKPYKAWPAWWYGPNGEAQVFQRPEDVPDGWKTSPSAHFEPPPAPTPPPMTRKAVIAALTLRGVAFQRNAPTSVLYELLERANGDLSGLDNGGAA
jgi:hypothetical protein